MPSRECEELRAALQEKETYLRVWRQRVDSAYDRMNSTDREVDERRRSVDEADRYFRENQYDSSAASALGVAQNALAAAQGAHSVAVTEMNEARDTVAQLFDAAQNLSLRVWQACKE